MERILIAVLTCRRFRERADLARATWAGWVEGADVRYFIGRGEDTESSRAREGEVVLDVADDYDSFRMKVQAAFRWALEQGYDFLFKTDDDVYLIPERLLANATYRWEYAGRVRPASRENVAPKIYGGRESAFCSGFGYWLSRRAFRICAEAADNGDWAEDRFVGNTLARAGVRAYHDPSIQLWPPIVGHFCSVPNPDCVLCVREYVNASVVCPYDRPQAILGLHKWWTERRFIPTGLPQ